MARHYGYTMTIPHPHEIIASGEICEHSARWLASTQLKNAVRHWRGRPGQGWERKSACMAACLPFRLHHCMGPTTPFSCCACHCLHGGGLTPEEKACMRAHLPLPPACLHSGLTPEEKAHLRTRLSCLIPQEDNQVRVWWGRGHKERQAGPPTPAAETTSLSSSADAHQTGAGEAGLRLPLPPLRNNRLGGLAARPGFCTTPFLFFYIPLPPCPSLPPPDFCAGGPGVCPHRALRLPPRVAQPLP